MVSLRSKPPVQEELKGSRPEGLTSEAREGAHVACCCATEFELQGWVSHTHTL